MDPEAEQDCETIVGLLTAEGLSPVILDDSARGVPEGVYEVCVPPAQSAKAEQIIIVLFQSMADASSIIPICSAMGFAYAATLEEGPTIVGNRVFLERRTPSFG